MTNLMSKIGTIVFIALIIGIMASSRSCSNYKNKYNAELAEKDDLMAKYDSILSLPPDTIEGPIKVVKNDTVIYVDRWRDPIPKTAKVYKDSLINDSIDVRVTITADKLYSLSYAYKPIFKYQEKIVNKNVPYPVEVVKEIKVPQRGFYLNAGLGFGDEVLGKIGVQFLTEKNTSYSFDYMRYGSSNIYALSYGIKL